MLQSGYILGGKYEIQQEVGRGGMSIVYLAMDRRINKVWAVKEVKASGKDQNGEIFAAQFIQEAEMLMQLDHPALPRIVDLIDENNKKYVVMDFVEGQNLFEVIKERGSFEEEEVIEWAKQITDALGYLHRQNPPIIYRDMKPGNVMLKPDGNIKIIDFGIARRYKVGNLTDTVALGTQGYVPPEQYSGQTDPRSDIFAIGMTMHHLLTGVDPRTADAYAPVRNWKPNLSEGIELIVNKCTAPAPEKRYQNCDELLYDLSHPDQITKDYRNKQKSKLRTFILTAVTGAVLLCGGIGMQVSAHMTDQADYVKLIDNMESPTANFDDLSEDAKKAAKLQPSNPEPLQILVKHIWDNPSPQNMHEQMVKLRTLYNSFQLDGHSDPEELIQLNLSIARLYLTNYSTQSGNTSNDDRFRNAYQFLQNNQKMIDSLPADAKSNMDEISEDYYHVLDFYVNKVMTAAYASGFSESEKEQKEAEEQNQKIIDTFFSTANDVVNDKNHLYGSNSSNPTNGAANRLLLYKAISVSLADVKGKIADDRKDEIIRLSQEIDSQITIEGDVVEVGGVQTEASTLYKDTATKIKDSLKEVFGKEWSQQEGEGE